MQGLRQSAALYKSHMPAAETLRKREKHAKMPKEQSQEQNPVSTNMYVNPLLVARVYKWAMAPTAHVRRIEALLARPSVSEPTTTTATAAAAATM